jgi:hypothetical protein
MFALLLAVLGAEPMAQADGPSPDKYDTVVYLSGELAASIPLAAEKLLGPQKEAKECMRQIQSYRVHASVDGDLVTVLLIPNRRCGDGIKGGGGRVTLDAKTLKILNSRKGE